MYFYLLHEWNEDAKNLNSILIKGKNKTMYIIETDTQINGENVQENDQSFEVIDSVNELRENTFAVFNNIPVTEEGRSLFEDRFNNRARKIEDEPGFAAIRVCRPINSDTYIILTLWESEADFENWRNSNAYKHAHKRRGTSEGIDQQQPQIFPRPSYVETYQLR